MTSRDYLLSRLDSDAQLALKGSTTTRTGATTSTYTPPKTSPTRTQTFQQKDNLTQSLYDAGRSPGASASWAPQVTAPSTGGGGGGGFTPTTEPPPREEKREKKEETTEVTGPGGAGGEGAGDLLNQFTEQEIEAALAALEAQYGMTREQLLQDQTLIGAQYRLLMSRLARQRTLATAAATDDAVGRGIYRSGILGENIQNIEQDFQQQTTDAETQRLAQAQAIQSQIDFLEQRRAAEAAQIEAGLRREQANYYLAAGVSPAAGMAAAPVQPPAQPVAAGVGGTAPISGPNMGAPQMINGVPHFFVNGQWVPLGG